MRRVVFWSCWCSHLHCSCHRHCQCILHRSLGPVHTGRKAPRNRRTQSMGHTVVNVIVHTACKQKKKDLLCKSAHAFCVNRARMLLNFCVVFQTELQSLIGIQSCTHPCFSGSVVHVQPSGCNGKGWEPAAPEPSHPRASLPSDAVHSAA